MGPRWLYEFARLRRGAPPVEQERIAWEALTFANGGKGGEGTAWGVRADAAPPPWADVTRVETQLWGEILAPLRDKGTCDATWAGRLRLLQDGTVTAQTVTDQLPFREAFLCQAVAFLREQAERGIRLRFCRRCKNPFAAKRPDAKHCPGTSCRTLAWRQADPVRFRKIRKDAYRRKVSPPSRQAQSTRILDRPRAGDAPSPL